MSTTSAAVVVPLHKPELSADEKLSLSVIRHVLRRHPLIAVGPRRLQSGSPAADLHNFSYEAFPDEDFASIGSYNRLLLSPRFYRRFENYEHILIAQPDALVFRDDLAHWCALPYDYVGAPWAYGWAYWPAWLSAYKRARALLYQRMDWRSSHKARLRWCALRVGNGGFSLRRVPAFLRVLDNPPPVLDRYLQEGLPAYPEDFFWGIDVNRGAVRLRVPAWQTALAFAVESAPEQALRRLGGLPFGTHAWDRGFRQFWMEQLHAAGLPPSAG